MNEAKQARSGGWQVVSMKNDWKQIFAFESGATSGKGPAEPETHP